MKKNNPKKKLYLRKDAILRTENKTLLNIALMLEFIKNKDALRHFRHGIFTMLNLKN